MSSCGGAARDGILAPGPTIIVSKAPTGFSLADLPRPGLDRYLETKYLYVEIVRRKTE